MIDHNEEHPIAINNSRRHYVFSTAVILAAVLIAYYVMSAWYPYAENIYNSNTDWSKIKNAGLEPWDGTLLGMYLLTFVAWAAIGFASLLAGTKIRMSFGAKAGTLLFATGIALTPVAVTICYAL